MSGTGLFHVRPEIAGRSVVSDQMDIISGVECVGCAAAAATHTPHPQPGAAGAKKEHEKVLGLAKAGTCYS
ncbi:hypothetical protein KDA_01010 [Dictyobacter alpinus]|uniref:Uncharacterized protein n=1 Tax=Dictyobacter alpinus TaxID=2014873 RepID=A0A402AZY0_9CHLR|nr:hypothetical protein KDA_01010 [Dictyobacter alpinus]